MNFSLSLFLMIFLHCLSLPLNNIFTVIFSDFFSSLLFTEFHLESSSHSDFTNPIEETKATSASFYRFHSRVLRIAIRSTPPSPTYEWKFHRQPTHPTRSFSALCCCCCGVEKKKTGEMKIYVSRSFCPLQHSAQEWKGKNKREKSSGWEDRRSIDPKHDDDVKQDLNLTVLVANERKTKLWFDLVIVDTNRRRGEKGAEAPKLVSLMK